ncbi:MAG: site-specific DNA-methyltransferase [Chloroflexi bacterium]|nr:site-specific DNA-methyltransferase [Chloroflexota bacterium]
MIIEYAGKKTEQQILTETPLAILKRIAGTGASKNMLIQGNNLLVLDALANDDNLRGKIGLVYIDPPFATNTQFRIGVERTSTISQSNSDAVAYADTMLGENYLEFLRERLIFLRELMSPSASIYLHIDYKIGHYVKVIMDEIFGKRNFRNDITRIKCNPKNFQRKAFGNIKDLILFYSKSDNPTWNDPSIPLSEDDIERLFRKIDKDGRRYTTVPLHAPGETTNGKTGQTWKGLKPPKGRHWRTAPSLLDELDQQGLIEWSATGVPRKKIFADQRENKKMQDIWDFKDPQYPSYPTEKNLELIKFILQASSNAGELVLDCFCGSGTTLVAAQALGRSWIGIDESPHAIETIRKRLSQIPADLFTGTVEYEFLIEQTTVTELHNEQ